MSQELQHLINRIQDEAVDHASQESERILAQAKSQAAALIQEAESQAATLLEQAEVDAEQFTRRSQRTLQQAGRNLVISIGEKLDQVLSDVTRGAVDETLKPETLSNILTTLVESYAEKQGAVQQLDVLLSEENGRALEQELTRRFQNKLKGGGTIETDPDLPTGFNVSFNGEKACHDFSHEAIAATLAETLRPELAAIIQKAVTDDKGSE